MANPVEITKSVCPTACLISGTANTGTANTASPLTVAIKVRYGVKLRTPATGEVPPNTDEVYIGDSSVNASNGWAMRAGDTLDLQVDDLSQLYIFSPTANQTVQWIGT